MKILIANRGEIAIRIIRSCRELGLDTVAVYSSADQNALHTRFADQAVEIGPPDPGLSYLKIENILQAAQDLGAGAIHPGYGFLSENPQLARAAEELGLIFIGPRPETMQALGDKLTARKAARDAGLQVLPGPDRPLTNLEPELPVEMSFPVLVKAAAGGGGKGIRLARSMQELQEVVSLARQEASSSFGDDTVFLEPLVSNARHIEVQILGDGTGRVLSFGERECSIQRRHQKLIEEAPGPGLSEAEKTCLARSACRLASSLKYRSLGTVEFLMDSERQFHFIEVNPRIQVEHPVTEMITGIDLVKEQIQLALTGKLELKQEDIQPRGAAVEARVLAEDPEAGFLPTSGEVSYLKEPGGPGIRTDSSLFQGLEITAEYDSLLAKLIAWGPDRDSAIKRLRRAIKEYQIHGIKTDLAFLEKILESHPYQEGRISTTFLDSFDPGDYSPAEDLARDAAVAAALHVHRRKAAPAVAGSNGSSPWQQAARREQTMPGYFLRS